MTFGQKSMLSWNLDKEAYLIQVSWRRQESSGWECNLVYRNWYKAWISVRIYSRNSVLVLVSLIKFWTVPKSAGPPSALSMVWCPEANDLNWKGRTARNWLKLMRDPFRTMVKGDQVQSQWSQEEWKAKSQVWISHWIEGKSRETDLKGIPQMSAMMVPRAIVK